MNKVKASFVACLLALVAFSGCDKPPSAEAKTQLATVATQAKALATDFSAWKGKLVAKNQADAADVLRWVNAHNDGLASEADSLQNANQAVASGSKLSGNWRAQLVNFVDTVNARVKNFSAEKKFVNLDAETEAKFNSHAQDLANFATALEKLNTLINPPPAAPAQ